MFTSGSRKSQQSQSSDRLADPTLSSSSTAAAAPTQLANDYTPAPETAESFLQSSSFADPARLHPLAGLDKDTLEYLVLDDAAPFPGQQSVIPTRGFFDDMCYGAGVCYLSGLGVGGAWGMRDGLIKSGGQPPRLRLNAVLNAVTRRGPFLGNSAGVVAIIYNIASWSVGQVRGKHDAANTVVAGALSGMLFRSTRGLRPMMISGGVVASVAGAWAVSG
jgi:import inner membrane translocase subunit TIM23